MVTFTLDKGSRYRATLTLGWVEQFAGNETIAAELAKAGFADIDVQGSGGTRVAEGIWTRETMDVPLPEQVTEVVAVG